MYIDSHTHYSDERVKDSDIEALLSLAKSKQITQFMLAGISPEEWVRQKELQKKYPDVFFSALGLHPYFVSASSSEDCELALDHLASLLNTARGIGEMGLDFREKILQSTLRSPEVQMAHQMEFFENQIELSRVYKKPMVLHVVQAHEKALEMLDLWGYENQVGMVHAFSGSYEVAKKYIDNGFLISIGSAVTYDKNKKIKEAVSKIPLDQILLESDMPDQPPQGWNGANNSTSLWQIAQQIAALKNTTAEEVLKASTDNFKKLFSI